jgi:NAD(P)-dependent dehydrogenase (short-subunit alcohol dehydrogenase family)
VPLEGAAAYCAAKGGLGLLTQVMALELAPHGITVNAVGPGLVRTNLGGGSDEAYLAQVIPTIPLGRAGQPEDIAGPIAFLCSDEASYMTGSMLFIDGGMLLTAHT